MRSFRPLDISNISKKKVNKAGEILVKTIPGHAMRTWARQVLSSWRAKHVNPIFTFKMTLRNRARKINKRSFFGQRLKREPSIINKLISEPTMKLTTMQDIAGIRAVLPTLKNVKKLHSLYVAGKRLRHEFKDQKNYIERPKPDGYRSIHLVYKYRNDKFAQFNDSLIEIQIRTKIQHIWATAVETVGFIINKPLKSRIGPKNWKDFFAVVSSAFAHIEGSPRVPGYEHLTMEETVDLIKKFEPELEALYKLKGIVVAIERIDSKIKAESDKKTSAYHLIVLNMERRTLGIKSYSRSDVRMAIKDYMKIESTASSQNKIEPVLVSAGNIQSLEKAYPNYFLDISEFIMILENIISKSERHKKNKTNYKEPMVRRKKTHY